MSDKQIITTISLKDDEELLLTKQSRYKATPNYYKIGNGTYSTRYKMDSRDLLKEVLRMTAAEQWMFNLLKENLLVYNSTEVSLVDVELSSADKQKLKLGYSRLREKDLVRRVKRQHYMINPTALIPTGKEVDMEVEIAEYLELK